MIVLITTDASRLEEWAEYIDRFEDVGNASVEHFHAWREDRYFRDEVPTWEAFCDYFGAGYVTPEDFENAFRGVYDSAADYALELAQDIGMVADNYPSTTSYFDAESFARDLQLGGDIVFDAPTGAVFDGHF